MQKLAEFVKRDFRMEVAYRAKFASDLVYVIFVVILYHFIARLVGHKTSAELAGYQSDYFSFVVVGVGLGNLLQAGLQSYTENVRKFMAEGSLEAMFATPTSPYALIVYSSVWPFIYATCKMALQFFVAYIFFGFTLRHANLTSTLFSIALSMVMFNSIGVISASLMIILKKGDPINWVLIQLSYIFGGVLFPIELLPRWGQAIAALFPINHALTSARFSLLTGKPPGELLSSLIPLLIFTLVSLPLSIYVSTSLVNRARRSGALSLF